MPGPLLDVTEAILDPMFMDTTPICGRNVQTIGTDGIARITTTNIPFSAVIEMEHGAILERLAAGERIATTIIMHSLFKLIDGKSGYTADVVAWQSQSWTVIHTEPYTRYGPGWVRSLLQMITEQGGDI